MNKENNDVLTAVILLKRVTPRLHANSRETIKRQHLTGIESTLTMVLRSLNQSCNDPLVLTPIMEVITLIENVLSDDTFVETDAETKELIVARVDVALTQLCIFAGKFYMENEFSWTLTKTDTLREIVDVCMDNGFYFGYDKQLRTEGLI